MKVGSIVGRVDGVSVVGLIVGSFVGIRVGASVGDLVGL